MSIEQELGLDTSPARSALDDLGQSIEAIAAVGAASIGDAIAVAISGAVASVDLTEAIASIQALELTPITLTPDINTDDLVAEVGLALESIGAVVPVEVDASAITESVDSAIQLADTIIPVEADVSTVTESIDAAVNATDQVIEITPEVDTSGLEAGAAEIDASLSSTGASASQASGGVEQLTGATEGFAAAAALSKGETSGLTGVLGGISPGAAAAAGGILAVGAATHSLFEAGLSLTAGEERLNVVFGDQAEAVQQIDVGGLTGNIEDLGIQVGTADGAMQQATASIGQFGFTAGASSSLVQTAAAQVDALALRAVALKPSLGSAGDVAQKLQRALATGGRFAANFGIALDAGAIKARAQTIALADGRAEFTRFDQIAAGAALTVEKLGGKLGTDFDKGSKQAQTQLASLEAQIRSTLEQAGQPIVMPVIETLKEVAPVAQTVAISLGEVIGAVLPLVAALASDLAPAVVVVASAAKILTVPLELVATILDAIPAPAVEAAAALFLITKTAPLVGRGIDLIITGARALPGIIATAGTAVSTFFGEQVAQTTASVSATAAVDVQIASLQALGFSYEEAAAAAAAFIASEGATAGAVVLDETAIAAEVATLQALGFSYAEATVAAEAFAVSQAEVAAASAAAASGEAISASAALGDGLVGASAGATTFGAAVATGAIAVAALALPVFAVTAALGFYDEVTTNAEKTTGRFSDELHAAAQSAEGVVPTVNKLVLAMNDGQKAQTAFGETADALGITQRGLVRAISTGGPELDRIKAKLQEASNTLLLYGNSSTVVLNGQEVNAQKARASVQTLTEEVDASRSAVEKATHAFDEQTKKLIDQALEEGTLTKAQVARIRSQDTLKSGDLDRVRFSADLTAAINHTTDAEKAHAEADAATAAAQIVLSSHLGGSRDAWIELSASIAAGQVTLADSAQIVTDFGISGDQAKSLIEGTTSAVESFISTAVSGLPGVGEAIDAVVSAATGLTDLSSALSSFSQAQQDAQQKTTQGIQDSADAQVAALQQAQQAAADQTDVRKRALQDQETAFQANISAQQKAAKGNAALIAQLEAQSAAHKTSTEAQLRSLDDTARTTSRSTADSISGLEKSTKDKIAGIQAAAKSATFDLPGFESSLARDVITTQQFFDNINTIASKGFPELAVQLEKLGPAAGGQLAASLAAQEPKVQEAFQNLLTPRVDARTFLTNLVASENAIRQFGTNIASIIDQFPNLADTLIKLGPQKGGALAQNVADGLTGPTGTLVATALERNLTASGTKAGDAYTRFLQNEVVPKLANAGIFLTPQIVQSLDPTGQLKIALEKAGQTVDTEGAKVVIKAGQFHAGLAAAAKGALESLPPQVAQALISAGVAIETNTPAGKAKKVGEDTVVEFKKGFDPAGAAGQKLLEAAGVIDKDPATKKSGRKAGRSVGESIAAGIRDSGGDITAGLKSATSGVGTSLAAVGAGVPIGGSLAEGMGLGVVLALPVVLPQAIAGAAASPGVTSTALGVGLPLGGTLATGIAGGLSVAGNAITTTLPAVIGSLANGLTSFGAGLVLGGSAAAGIGAGVVLASGTIQSGVIGATRPTLGEELGVQGQSLPIGGSIAQGIGLGLVLALPVVLPDALRGGFAGFPAAIAKALPNPELLLTESGVKLMEGLAAGINLGFVTDVIPALDHATKEIPKHKGPESVDRALLRGSGRLIMAGLTEGLDEGFTGTRTFLEQATTAIADTFSPVAGASPLTVQVVIAEDTLVPKFTALGEEAGKSFTAAASVGLVRAAVAPAPVVAARAPGVPGAGPTVLGGTGLTQAEVLAVVREAVAQGGVHVDGSLIGKIETTERQDPEAVANKVAFQIGAR